MSLAAFASSAAAHFKYWLSLLERLSLLQVLLCGVNILVRLPHLQHAC